MACPPFYNMLVAISDREDIIEKLDEDCLLRKFILLSKFFNPSEQIDKKSEFAKKTVNAETIFH
jgi:hypothetical protein